MWSYVCDSTLWSLGGLALGYFLGKTERDINEIKKRLKDDDS